jgi:beta-lactamase class A
MKMPKKYMVIIIIVVIQNLFLCSDEQVDALINNTKTINAQKISAYRILKINELKVQKKDDILKQVKQAESENNKLQTKIKEYLGDNISKVGISYYDITSNQYININSDKVFLAGSTVKVQLNMVLSDMLKSGQASQSEVLNYKDSEYEEGTGILQGTDMSKGYVITTLSDYSIIHSDNIATNMILERIGYENFRSEVDKKLNKITDHSQNYITAEDETILLKQLYTNKDNNSYYSHIIDIMKQTDFHDRLDKYLDKNIVAHKIGDYSDYVNDIGIVYTDRPYIISIYTEGLPNANEVIAQISKIIYDNR